MWSFKNRWHLGGVYRRFFASIFKKAVSYPPSIIPPKTPLLATQFFKKWLPSLATQLATQYKKTSFLHIKKEAFCLLLFTLPKMPFLSRFKAVLFPFLSLAYSARY